MEFQYWIGWNTDYPEIKLSIRIEESSEWPNLDWIITEWVQRSAWRSIQYWNVDIIGRAECWLNTAWVSGKISLMLYPVHECRKHRSGRDLIEYSMIKFIDQPDTISDIEMSESSEWPNLDWLSTEWVQKLAWRSIRYWNVGIILLAEFWLNTYWVSAKISLTLHTVLEYSNHRSGQMLIKYQVCGWKDQPDALSSNEMSEASEWLRFDWILNDQVHKSAWYNIRYWNVGTIGVAESWLTINWVSAKVSLTLYLGLKCRDHFRIEYLLR